MNSDNPTGKPVTTWVDAHLRLVNAVMNLGRAMFKAAMARWKPVADFPLRMIGAIASRRIPEVVTADFPKLYQDRLETLNSAAIALMESLGLDKVSFVVCTKEPNDDGTIERLIIPVPLTVMRLYQLQPGQEITSQKALPVIDSAGVWLAMEIARRQALD